jgi:hypothetical protein
VTTLICASAHERPPGVDEPVTAMDGGTAGNSAEDVPAATSERRMVAESARNRRISSVSGDSRAVLSACNPTSDPRLAGLTGFEATGCVKTESVPCDSVNRRLPLVLLLGLALAVVATAAAATRQPAPATAGPTLTGGKASLAALRGKPVFLNVWSSW